MRGIKKAALLFSLLLFTGCSIRQEETEVQEPETTVKSMESEPELVYEVPVSAPNILVNQLGYITEGTKTALFRGEELPEEFHVVREDDGQTVFTGYPVHKEYHEASKEYNGIGDFSAFREPGSYYVEAPVLGRSYSFRIGDDLYDEVFREACKQYYYRRCGAALPSEYAGERAHGACHGKKAALRDEPSARMDVSGGWHQDEEDQKTVCSGAQNMSLLLLAYELYGEVFTDDTGILESGNGIPDLLDEVRYESEWLLKMQDEQTGGVYAGVSALSLSGEKEKEAVVEPLTSQASAAFAFVMAKFSYSYQDYDEAFAAKCLEAAKAAFKYVQKNAQEGMDEWKFAAAAELYRMLGKQRYHEAVSEYLSQEEYKENLNEINFLGCVTYLSTRRSVKIRLCEEIAKALMARAEDAAQNTKGFLGQRESTVSGDDHRKRLEDMMYLTMIDHMTTNYEYGTIIENQLHYFLGRNESAVSYIDNVGEKNYRLIDENLGIMNRMDTDGRLIFMLSGIMYGYKE